MKYLYSPEWTRRARTMVQELQFDHIPPERIACFYSRGSKSRRTIARIHTMPKIIQLGIQQPPFYAIELVSERFERQSEEEKLKTIIHELMHIPRSFNGGFRQHNPYVTHHNVEAVYRKWKAQALP